MIWVNRIWNSNTARNVHGLVDADSESRCTFCTRMRLPEDHSGAKVTNHLHSFAFLRTIFSACSDGLLILTYSRSRVSRSPRARRIQGPITPEDEPMGGEHNYNDVKPSSNFKSPVSSSASPSSGDVQHNFGSANLLVQPALREPAGNY